ncbi:MAG: hypothetical protein EOP53_10890 [Sphingobacteriales bacterium]|nr:MAG: hypothetical protein EOP53_10890 [Sphingobacteriales bacterium]
MKQKLQMLLNKSNIKQTLLNIAFILFLFSLAIRFISQLFTTHGYESWPVSEFLINYQGGFLRRGLLGETLFLLAKNFNINVEWTIKIFCIFCFAIVCIFFVKAFLKKGYTLYILPICFFLGMGAFSGFWLRKDYLMVFFLIAALWTYKSKLSTPMKILAINILAITILLIHESFAFFSLPILFLLFFNDYRNKVFLQRIMLSIVALLPSGLTFLLTLHYHGDIKIAQIIWDSWAAVANLNASELTDSSHGALSAIGWSRESAFNMHFKTNFLMKDMSVFSAVFWGMTLPIIYYIASNTLFAFRKHERIFSKKDRTILSSILIFQLICLLPFFLILSCDLLRIIFYWITSSFVIFLLVPIAKLEGIFPLFFTGFTERLNSFLSSIISPTKTTLILLMLFVGVPAVGFSFQKAIETNMVYNILCTLSYPLTALKKIIFTFF